jgi:hypothetical protein
VNWRINTSSRGRLFGLPSVRFSASLCIPDRITSPKSGSSVVTVYLLCFPVSSTTTWMLFLRFPFFVVELFSLSISSILLPSEGIAVVLLLRMSVALSLDRGLSRLPSSMSDMSDDGSGVHVSRVSNGGLLESPWNACDMVDWPSVSDVKSGLELFVWVAILLSPVVEAYQSFATSFSKVELLGFMRRLFLV